MVLAGGIVAAVVTAPKPNLTAGIGDAALEIEAGNYAEALDLLNSKVLPHMSGDRLTPDERRTFHVLRARALYLGQKELGLDRRENHENIRREYEKAESLHAVLGDDDQYYAAHTLISLGEIADAANRLERVGVGSASRRIELLKRLIDVSLKAGEPGRAGALDLVTVLAADPDLSREDRVWTLVRQAELLVSGGYAGDAITKILRALPRLDGIEAVLDGELRVTLAKAYLAEGAMDEARAQLDAASARLGGDHALTPLVTLLQAEIDHFGGELQRARERYTEVIERYSYEAGRPAALLGLAEVEAQISNTQREVPLDASLERYTQLVDMLKAGGAGDDSAERIGRSLLARFQEQFDSKAYDQAMRFGALAERLYGPESAPPELLLGLGETRKRLAEDLLRHAAGDGGALSLAQADPTTQREAREHLIRAGEYFKLHASKMVQNDARAYGESLWAAADAFDRAGDVDASVQAFQQFTTDFPSDPRQPEAAFRLAQAYRARGDLELAAQLYQRLLEARGRIDGPGPWGDQCMVPLAQTLLADADSANDARAEEILTQVVSGDVVGPGTPIFREALRELGDHLHRTGRHAPAIERFEQYLALAGEKDGDQTGVRYRLAEAYRRSAEEIGRSLEAGMPDGVKRSLQAERGARLRRAMDLYERVRRQYETSPHRSAIEDVQLRNACFFLGDCAYDLRDFDTAIRHYDAARERYARDPAALVAMTQIVNALLEQGRREQAAIANERAKRFFASLPESVWEDPTLPMSRSDWERWLAAQDRLTNVSASAGEGRP